MRNIAGASRKGRNPALEEFVELLCDRGAGFCSDFVVNCSRIQTHFDVVVLKSWLCVGGSGTDPALRRFRWIERGLCHRTVLRFLLPLPRAQQLA